MWYGKSYHRQLIGNHTLAFYWCHFWWPWSTFESHFSLCCHFHVHFSYPWHAFASHGLPAIAELLVLYPSFLRCSISSCHNSTVVSRFESQLKISTRFLVAVSYLHLRFTDVISTFEFMCELIFQEFQPIWPRYVNVTDGRTDGRTDRQLAMPIPSYRPTVYIQTSWRRITIRLYWCT